MTLRRFIARRLQMFAGQASFTLGVSLIAAALLLYRTPTPPVKPTELTTMTGVAHVQHQRTKRFLTVTDGSAKRLTFTCDRRGCSWDERHGSISGREVTVGYLAHRPDRLYTLQVADRSLLPLDGSNRVYASTAAVPFGAAALGMCFLLMFCLLRPPEKRE